MGLTDFEFDNILKEAMSQKDEPSDELNEKLKAKLASYEENERPSYLWARNVAASVIIVLTALTAVLNSSESVAVNVNKLPVIGAVTKNLTFRDYYENVPAEIAKKDAVNVNSNDIQNKIIVPEQEEKKQAEKTDRLVQNKTSKTPAKKENSTVIKRSVEVSKEKAEDILSPKSHTEVVINNADSAIFGDSSEEDTQIQAVVNAEQGVEENGTVTHKTVTQTENNMSVNTYEKTVENLSKQAMEETVNYSVNVASLELDDDEEQKLNDMNEKSEEKVSGGGSSAMAFRGGGGANNENEPVTLDEPAVVEAAMEDEIPVKINNIYDFGIEMKLKKIKPTGAKLICSQSEGTVTGELTTGSEYTIEVKKNGEWEKLDYVTEIMGWTLIGYTLDKNSSIEFDINWENVYGKLPKGEYRISKEFMDFRSAGDYDEQRYYALFEIK